MNIDCFKCQYFRVTWDPHSPRGCSAYGFKTKLLPSVLVKKSSGMDCLKFVPKKREGQR